MTNGPELFKLRNDLAVAQEAARSNEISNDRYYSDGSKRLDDARIGKLRERIKELEKVT